MPVRVSVFVNACECVQKGLRREQEKENQFKKIVLGTACMCLCVSVCTLICMRVYVCVSAYVCVRAHVCVRV